ncbi:uncharacterized protein LAJ45_08991 [Morchella importuna]|uniref:uncharacterized protein n=1 Tax=Morchella importuna TaxID=1174673 RepID=UPI001E8D54EC|nr:uncharacterized protein LAJ45_08991 [Morchella importuna]KAH8146912.1 hypothetical protein LAJ45_08991 [Morchella importuna]
MLQFYGNGDLQGPTDYLNEWTDARWEEAYRCIPHCKETKESLEDLLANVRVLVQMHSDLLYNPYRTSNNPGRQISYWDIYYPWYRNDLTQSIASLKYSLRRFWTSGVGKQFAEPYKGRLELMIPSSIQVRAWRMINSQFDSLETYCSTLGRGETLQMIRKTLNPTGSGAQVLSVTMLPKIPVVLRNPTYRTL